MARMEAERCYVYGGAVDLRKGAAGLIALIGKAEEEVLYVFSNRTRALLKFVAYLTDVPTRLPQMARTQAWR